MISFFLPAGKVSYMEILILLLSIMYIMFLIYEHKSLSEMRKGFRHIVHVNGTRGKSTVCRLIYAGLSAGGLKVFAKTTGTSPRMLYVDGSEHEIRRRGRANIKEQIKTIRKAREQGAEILVLECMAVKPELQELSQQRLVKADIGVITNVRMDHLDEMGRSLDEIAEALSLTIPENGRLFTADTAYSDYFGGIAKRKGSEVLCAEEAEDGFGEIDFIENVALALRVCQALEVDREAALVGMRGYLKDPGSLRIYKKKNKAGSSLTFVNALAVNDPQSTMKIMDQVFLKSVQPGEKRVLLINNRGDRLTRLQQFSNFAIQTRNCFDKILICGPQKHLAERSLKSGGVKADAIRFLNNVAELDKLQEDSAIFAVGNIAGFGRLLMEYMEEAGDVLGR
ncbi:MAG: poly-gamma-glutamate synthase PgsB [Pseudomonadota bacterium]